MWNWTRIRKPEDFEAQFVAVIRATARCEAMTFEEGAKLLQDAPGALLRRFDTLARRRWWDPHNDPRSRSRALLRRTLDRPDRAEVLLFFEACNHNGHVREQALRALRGHHGRLVIAAALLRADDWVPQVARLAEGLLDEISQTERAQHFFEFLELILALRRKSRFTRHWAAVEGALLAPARREERLRAMNHPGGSVRRFAHELALRADSDDGAQTLRSAATDSSPMVASWALARAVAEQRGESLRAILRAGQRNLMSSIRVDALRRYLAADFPDARELLLAALFDRSHVVRRCAAFHLQERFTERALPLWRAKFDAGQLKDSLTVELADSGEREDEARLRSQISARRARTRAAALRGLWRLGSADVPKLLKEALHDSATRMVAAAILIHEQGNEPLRYATLESALSKAASGRLRATLLTASRLLPKWERLELLLRQYRGGRADSDAMVERELQRWVELANRSFLPLAEAQRDELGRLLAALRREKPSPLLERIGPYCAS